eukprot:UN22857
MKDEYKPKRSGNFEGDDWADKGQFREREEDLSNLINQQPDQIDRSAEREIDTLSFCQRIQQFFNPTSGTTLLSEYLYS